MTLTERGGIESHESKGKIGRETNDQMEMVSHQNEISMICDGLFHHQRKGNSILLIEKQDNHTKPQRRIRRRRIIRKSIKEMNIGRELFRVQYFKQISHQSTRTE